MKVLPTFLGRMNYVRRNDEVIDVRKYVNFLEGCKNYGQSEDWKRKRGEISN